MPGRKPGPPLEDENLHIIGHSVRREDSRLFLQVSAVTFRFAPGTPST